MKCHFRYTYAIVLIVGCALLAGCGGIALNHDYGDYAEVYGTSTDSQILLNLARLSRDEPPYFIQLGQITAQHTLTTTAGLTSTTSGISKVTGMTVLIVSLGAAVGEQPTFQFVPLNGQTFMQAVTNPIDKKVFFNFYSQNVPADLLARVMVASVSFVQDPTQPGPAKILVNDPDDPSYAQFLAWCYDLRSQQILKKAVVRAVAPVDPQVQINNPSVSDITKAEEDGFVVVPPPVQTKPKPAPSQPGHATVAGPIDVTNSAVVTISGSGATSSSGSSTGQSGGQSDAKGGSNNPCEVYWKVANLSNNTYPDGMSAGDIGRKDFQRDLDFRTELNSASTGAASSVQDVYEYSEASTETPPDTTVTGATTEPIVTVASVEPAPTTEVEETHVPAFTAESTASIMKEESSETSTQATLEAKTAPATESAADKPIPRATPSTATEAVKATGVKKPIAVLTMRTFISAMQGVAKEEQLFKAGFQVKTATSTPSATAQLGCSKVEMDGDMVTFTFTNSGKTLSVVPIMELSRDEPLGANQKLANMIELNYRDSNYSVSDVLDAATDNLSMNRHNVSVDLISSNRQIFTRLSILFTEITLDPKTLPAQQIIQAL